jgi:hypothetical protein
MIRKGVLVTRQIRVFSLGVCLFVAAFGFDRPLLGQSADLPSAKDVIAKQVTALGGAEAFGAIKSIRQRGRFEMAAQGIGGDVELLSARPAKTRQHIEIPGIGSTDAGFDGTIGWSLNPMTGPSLGKGKELAQARDDAQFDGALHLPALIKEMTTVARVEFDGHQAYKLKVVTTGGIERFEYFDVDSGLMVGIEGDAETPMGTVPQTMMMRDYKKFGALMQPTTLVVRAMGAEQLLHITSVEYDVVPPDAFDLPPQIKALIK